MKRFSMIPFSLVLLALLFLSFQSTALASSLKGPSIEKQANGCPSVVGKGKVTPNCTPHPPCVATSCYNLDPYAEGCDTATAYNTISYVSVPMDEGTPGGLVTYGYLTNYYSSWCNANWALVSATTAGHNASIITDLQIKTTDSNKNKEEMCYPVQCNPFSFYTGGTYPSWTNMVDGTNTTYAYLYAEVYGPDGYYSLLPYPLEANQ